MDLTANLIEYVVLASGANLNSDIQDVVNKFDAVEKALKSTFGKVDPRTVVNLILETRKNPKPIYTVEVVIEPGQDTESIRDEIMRMTGTAPGFYLRGEKIIANHALDLELLKYINDHKGVISIKGSPYSASGSSDF